MKCKLAPERQQAALPFSVQKPWYRSAMKAAIDAAGRVIVPKALRDELGLSPGLELEIQARDGALVLTPSPTAVALTRRGGVVVAKPRRPLPKLTEEDVRAVLEGARR